MRRLIVVPLTFILLTGCGAGQNPSPGGTVGQIQAATGGVIEAGGVKLTIPAGALSQNATVTLVGLYSMSIWMTRRDTSTGVDRKFYFALRRTQIQCYDIPGLRHGTPM